MSIQFVIASTTKLLNTAPPITAFPFTVGFWFYFTAVGGTETMWGIFDTASGNNYFEIYKDGTNKLHFSAFNGATSGEAITTGTVSAGAWHYVVLRAISASNRRISVLFPNGSTEHVQNTTSVTPSSLDTESLGNENYNSPDSYFGGRIAEYFKANADVQADGAALQDTLLRQLAYGGPFSVPSFVPNIVDYRSFRQSISSDKDVLGDVYSGRAGRQVWTPTNGPTLAPHPPLPYWHVRPGQTVRTLVPI